MNKCHSLHCTITFKKKALPMTTPTWWLAASIYLNAVGASSGSNGRSVFRRPRIGCSWIPREASCICCTFLIICLVASVLGRILSIGNNGIPLILLLLCVHPSASGGYFSTSGDDPSIKIRMKDDYDGAEPTASSVTAINLFR